MLYKKLTIFLLLAITTVAAFATLGEGKAKNATGSTGKKSLLSIKTSVRPGSLSLRPGYNFRGSQVISNQDTKKYISLNTPVSYQTGHTSYTVPLKKRVVLNDKIVFNPNAATRH